MHTFWEIVASNALLVTALAVGVAVVGRVWRNPAALHLLWLLVLLKLFTPPLVTIGIPLPWDLTAPTPKPLAVDGARPYPSAARGPSEELAAASEDAAPLRSADAAIEASVSAAGRPWPRWSMVLAWTWGIGIVLVASARAGHIIRFRSVLRRAQSPPASLSRASERIARRLGLKRVPEILMLPVRLSPLVWSVGGRPRVILPADLPDRLGPDALETILMHELAHVRRKDHLVRLLELVATTLFWWHPVVWWACGRLRELEEQCCDALVLDTVSQGARAYATALVDTLDFLSETSIAVPLGATAAKRSVSLARRIEMLKNHHSVARLTVGRFLLLATAVAVPMTLALAAAPPRADEAPPPSPQECVEWVRTLEARLEPVMLETIRVLELKDGRRDDGEQESPQDESKATASGRSVLAPHHTIVAFRVSGTTVSIAWKQNVHWARGRVEAFTTSLEKLLPHVGILRRGGVVGIGAHDAETLRMVRNLIELNGEGREPFRPGQLTKAYYVTFDHRTFDPPIVTSTGARLTVLRKISLEGFQEYLWLTRSPSVPSDPTDMSPVQPSAQEQHDSEEG